MIKKIISIVKRGPAYTFKKAVMYGDHYYRTIVRKRYIVSYVQKSPNRLQYGTSGCSLVFAEKALQDSHFMEAGDTAQSRQILQMANRFNEDYMLLFGKWVFIPRANGHYPWDSDFVQHVQYPFGLYTSIKIKNNAGEIKIPWELGRMHALPVLALAWRLSEEEKYLDKIRWLLSDFCSCAPLGYGVQWVCTMEVGIRIFNILTAYVILKDKLSEADELHGLMEQMAWQHGIHIFNNLETAAHLHSNNHYLADLLGLFTIGALFPFSGKGARWYRYAKKELEKETAKQILDDGICFEMSTAYTRLDAEMLLYCMLIAQSRQDDFSDSFKRKLLAVSSFLHEVSDGKNTGVQIGDNDSGRILILHNHPIMSLGYIADLIDYALKKGSRFGTAQAQQELFWLFSEYAPKHYERLYKDQFSVYKQAGTAVLRTGDLEVFLYNCDAMKYDVPGHTHNDHLAISLYLKGIPVIVDPGTGKYTSDTNLRDYFRSTHQHSTYSVNHEEQNTLTKVFGMERCVTKTGISAQQNNEISICGWHNGYHQRFGIVCCRRISAKKESGNLQIEDTLEGSAEKIQNSVLSWAFMLHPQVHLQNIDQHTWKLICGEHAVIMRSTMLFHQEAAYYSDTYFSAIPTYLLRSVSPYQNDHRIEFYISEGN